MGENNFSWRKICRNISFIFRNFKIKKTIPEKEIFKGTDNIEVLPNSFYSALFSFLIVAAQKLLTPEKFGKTISMMVHPDRAVNSHLNWGEMIEEEFKDWAEDISKYGSKNSFKRTSSI